MQRLNERLGFLSAVPMLVVFAIALFAPLIVVALFSIMPPKVFSLANMPDFSAYSVFFSQGYYKSLLWSLGMALASTLILLVVCWPLAFGMAKVFKGFTLVLSIAVVMSLFVSENIRLFGWVLTLMKGGLIEGHFRAYSFDPALEEAARDMGADTATILREITLPLLMPGLVSAGLFAFLLSWGNVPLSLFITGADSTLPEWLYAKMVSGYSPLVPTLGILSVIASFVVILTAFPVYWLYRSMRESRAAQN